LTECAGEGVCDMQKKLAADQWPMQGGREKERERERACCADKGLVEHDESLSYYSTVTYDDATQSRSWSTRTSRSICISSDVGQGETIEYQRTGLLPVAGHSRRRPSFQRFASRVAETADRVRVVWAALGRRQRHVLRRPKTRNLEPARYMAITCHRHIMCWLVWRTDVCMRIYSSRRTAH